MRVVFRVDSSFQIGTGHLRRCLVLAEQLRKRDAEITFISHHFPGNLNHLIIENDFTLLVLPYLVTTADQHVAFIENNWELDAHHTKNLIRQYPNIDYLVVDHYALEERWEKVVNGNVQHVIVIDDLANRKHYCDTLVDQNLLQNIEKRYVNLVPAKAKLLLGPKYLLLREEFRQTALMKTPHPFIKNIFISFGGTDPTNETCKTLEAITDFSDYDLEINTIISTKHPEIKRIQAYANHNPAISIHTDTKQMAALMATADLAIGAGGTTTWERCYLQVPTFTIETALNQHEILNYLDSIGFLCHLGKSKDVSTGKIQKILSSHLNDTTEWRAMRIRLKAFAASVEDEAIARYMVEGN